MVRLQRVARGEKGDFIAVGVTEEDGYPAAVELRPTDGSVKRKAIGSGGAGGVGAKMTLRTSKSGDQIWVMGMAQEGTKAGGLLRTSTRPTFIWRTESARLYEHSP